MRKIILASLLLFTLTGCNKYGVGGTLNHMVSNWVPVNLPSGCVPQQVSTGSQGLVVLCKDGRVFH